MPIDVVVSKSFSNSDKQKQVDIHNIPDGWQGLDIGAKTRKSFSDVVKQSNTILWNGPMGAFEVSPFDTATVTLAQMVAEATEAGRILSVAGGGDTVAALNHAGVAEKFSYVSLAGGAFLEYIEGKTLPGVAVLSA